MRKTDVFGYSFMIGVKDVKFAEHAHSFDEIDPNYVVSGVDQKDALLSLVYSLDERTKTPTGDLAYFVSDKANPEVKKFILDNLMMDVSAAAKPAIPDGLSDDDALLFSRGDSESFEDYVNRLNTEIERTKWLNEEYKKSFVPPSQSE